MYGSKVENYDRGASSTYWLGDINKAIKQNVVLSFLRFGFLFSFLFFWLDLGFRGVLFASLIWGVLWLGFEIN